MKNNWIGKGILCVIGIAALALGAGWVVMNLWNWLMPDIFSGASTIDFYHALGLLVLARILFGGWGGSRCGSCGHHGGHWRSRWKAKWEGMSEEERAKFRNRCGDWCGPEPKIDGYPK